MPVIPAQAPVIPARYRHSGLRRNLALVPPFSSVSATQFAPEIGAETAPNRYSIPRHRNLSTRPNAVYPVT